MKLNSTSIRRIVSAFVIATKTTIDVFGVQIFEHINDAYVSTYKLEGFEERRQRLVCIEKDGMSLGLLYTMNRFIGIYVISDEKTVDAPILVVI